MTRPEPTALLADLRAEGDLLEELLRQLPAPDSDHPRGGVGGPPPGAHLAWTEQSMLSAIKGLEDFVGLRERLAADSDVVDRVAQYAPGPPEHRVRRKNRSPGGEEERCPRTPS